MAAPGDFRVALVVFAHENKARVAALALEPVFQRKVAGAVRVGLGKAFLTGGVGLETWIAFLANESGVYFGIQSAILNGRRAELPSLNVFVALLASLARQKLQALARRVVFLELIRKKTLPSRSRWLLGTRDCRRSVGKRLCRFDSCPSPESTLRIERRELHGSCRSRLPPKSRSVVGTLHTFQKMRRSARSPSTK